MDIASFDQFTVLAPWTRINFNGSILQASTDGKTDPSREEARFCLDFVVDSALALRERRVPPLPSATEKQKRVRVKSRCEMIASPKADVLEVIRFAEPGEELPLASNRRVIKDSKFLAVIQDGDVAYVERTCLEDADHSS